MTTVRAKFQVTSIKRYSWGDHVLIELQTHYDDTIPEDRRFQGANISINLTNPAAFEAFELGKSFYVDFVVADDQEYSW